MARTMTSVLSWLSVSLLNAMALCRVGPGQGLDEDAKLMTNDSVVYYVNEVFDLSQVKNPVAYTANHGWVRDYKTILQSLSYPNPYHSVNAFEYINNQTYAAVLDNRNVVLQTMDLEGLTFTKTITFSYMLLGSNLRCDDVEVYYPEGLIFVGCWSMNPQPNFGPIFIVQLNLFDPTEQYVVYTVPQTDGFNLKTRLRLGIWTLSQGQGSNDTFLMVWDQTPSGTQNTQTQYFRAFSGLEVGQPKYIGAVNMTLGFPQLYTMYDLFGFNNQILVSSTLFQMNNIHLTACTYYEFNNSVFCDTSVTKSTSFSMGYVGMTLGGRYVEYDTKNTLYKSCEVTSNFSSFAWITSNCDVYNDFPTIQGTFVVGVEDNWSTKLITWVHPDGTYAGVSLHSRALAKSWVEEDTNAVIVGDTMYVATPSAFLVRRITYTSLFLSSAVLPDQSSSVSFTAQDPDNSYTEKGIYTVMYTALDEVYYAQTKQLPEIEIYAGTSFYFPMAEDEYFGNNLAFTPSFSFESDTSPLITYNTYTTYPVNIVFTFKNTGLPRFQEISFTDSFAVGRDYNDRLFLFECGASDIDQIRCNELHNIVVEDDDKLQVNTLELMGYVFSWITDKIRTRIIMWSSMAEESFALNFQGVASDVHATVINNRVWIFVAFQKQGIVHVRTWSPVNPKNFNVQQPINATNSYYGVFCPVDVYDTFNGTIGYIEVLSVCIGASPPDQRVFRYNATTMQMSGSHPIDLTLSNPMVCPVGNSYIFASLSAKTVVGRSLVNDESQFYFYLDQYVPNIRSLVGLNCVPELGVVVVNFIDGNNRLGYFTLWADSETQANKRVHSVVTGLASGTTYMQSFNVRGAVFHAVYSGDGSYSYMMSLTKAPVIKINVLSSNTADQNGRMTLSLTNGGSSEASTATAPITISYMNRTITVVNKGNKAVPGNNFNLEDYISIYGHVYNGYIMDERVDSSTSIHLLQRNTRTYKFFPPIVDQVIFSHLEAHGNYMIALHSDRSYASFFTIFLNMTNQGVIQPRDGVLAFDFVPSSQGRALIAYCSSVNSGSKLNFMLINGGYLVSEQALMTKQLYSKMRFADTGINNGYMLFAYNEQTESVDIFTVGIQNFGINPIYTYTIYGVQDFDVTDPGSRINMFYIMPESSSLSVVSWSKSSVTGAPNYAADIIVQANHNYWMRTVSCVNQLPDSNGCVINLMGSHFIEVVVGNGQNSPSLVMNLSKYGNYDGKYIYIDEEFIAMRAVTNLPPLSYSFLVWKRPSMGGDGYLYLGQDIEGEALPGHIDSGFTPFSLITYNGSSILFTGSHNTLEPLIFWKIGTYQITSSITNSNDLGSIFVEFMAYGSMYQTDSLAALTNQIPGGDDNKGSTNWWLIIGFIVGGLVFIGILVVTYLWFNSKSVDNSPMPNGTTGYQSIGPDGLRSSNVPSKPAQPEGPAFKEEEA